jgi:hypothetical protein
MNFYLICLQNAGSFSFSIGITEVLNTNIVLELSANDVDYVYQRYCCFLGMGIILKQWQCFLWHGYAFVMAIIIRFITTATT